jgi:hypothetical protein
MPEQAKEPLFDTFGNLDPEALEADLIANLPSLLRGRCCPPSEPWVSPDHHDHGHTDCYFMNLAADEIERLRASDGE